MKTTQTNKFGAKVVYEATQSLWNFSYEIEQTEMFIVFILIGNRYISNNQQQAKKIVAELHKDSTNSASNHFANFIQTNDGDPFFDAAFYERHVCQMAYSRMIDNFTTYFKDILAEIVLLKPQILKSKDHERLDFILSHETMEDLIQAISEKKIEELFYKGINDIDKFFEDRLGVKIFKDEKTKQEINLLIKQRNLIVHNRGKISKDLIREFPDMEFKIDHYLVFDYETISELNLELNNFIIDIDEELSAKFHLEKVKK